MYECVAMGNVFPRIGSVTTAISPFLSMLLQKPFQVASEHKFVFNVTIVVIKKYINVQ